MIFTRRSPMSKKFGSRSVASVVLAASLVISGSVALTVPAQAATGKQGAACTKAGAKLTSGKNTYTCGVNPTTTSKKLVWVSADCTLSQTAYTGAYSDYTGYLKTAADVITQLTSTLASYQNALTVAQAAQAAADTKVYKIGKDPVTKLEITAVGTTAAIAAIQAKIASDQASLAVAKDAASKTAWTNAISSRTSTLNTINRQITSIASRITSDQTQITTFTAQLANAQSSQALLAGQLKDAVTSAKSTRTLACKAGL